VAAANGVRYVGREAIRQGCEAYRPITRKLQCAM
jgi:hypothetical protein